MNTAWMCLMRPASAARRKHESLENGARQMSPTRKTTTQAGAPVVTRSAPPTVGVSALPPVSRAATPPSRTALPQTNRAAAPTTVARSTAPAVAPRTVTSRKAPAGSVGFVGAGPGDPGLITVRATELLAEAQVVVFAERSREA